MAGKRGEKRKGTASLVGGKIKFSAPLRETCRIFEYFCAMFGTFRNIASVILVVLMGICTIALVMNEYHSANLTGQELCMEDCLEPDADESEWDDENDMPYGAIGNVTLCPLYILHPDISVPANSSARRSLKQMRGLVRRYAPRKAIFHAPFPPTQMKGMDPHADSYHFFICKTVK